MRAFVSWSGGKDCTLALHHFLSDPQNEVSFLLNMSHETDSISKFHNFGSDVLFEQSHSLGIPLFIERVTSKGYEYHLKKIMKKFKEDGVGYGVFGDIFLEEHRDWITEVCREVGITPIFPLWGRETLSVIKDPWRPPARPPRLWRRSGPRSCPSPRSAGAPVPPPASSHDAVPAHPETPVPRR